MRDFSYAEFVDSSKGIVLTQLSLEMDSFHLIEVVGSAKCDPEDEFNPEIGARLALGRALRKLGRELLSEAHGEVHRRDKIRAHALETQAKARAEADAKAAAFKAAAEAEQKKPRATKKKAKPSKVVAK